MFSDNARACTYLAHLLLHLQVKWSWRNCIALKLEYSTHACHCRSYNFNCWHKLLIWVFISGMRVCTYLTHLLSHLKVKLSWSRLTRSLDIEPEQWVRLPSLWNLMPETWAKRSQVSGTLWEQLSTAGFGWDLASRLSLQNTNAEKGPIPNNHIEWSPVMQSCQYFTWSGYCLALLIS